MRISLSTVALLLGIGCCTTGYAETGLANNQDLERIKQQDQADRSPASGAIDWSEVSKRDAARKTQVLELYRKGRLNTGADYYNAALVLQHGNQPEDYLLAHELSVATIIKGEPRARLLAADSEDRFLLSIGRTQRFATQYGGQPMALFEVDDGPTATSDDVRKIFDVQSLATARQQEDLMRDLVLTFAERVTKYADRVKADPADAHAHRQLLRAYIGLGRTDDALTTAVTLVQLVPSSADDRYDLACLYAINGMKQDAVRSLGKAIELGYEKWEWITKDEDLATIRSEPEYGQLVARYPSLAAEHEMIQSP